MQAKGGNISNRKMFDKPTTRSNQAPNNGLPGLILWYHCFYFCRIKEYTSISKHLYSQRIPYTYSCMLLIS